MKPPIFFGENKNEPWLGWEYNHSGDLPLPFKLGGTSISLPPIPLPNTCECIEKDIFGDHILEDFFQGVVGNN